MNASLRPVSVILCNYNYAQYLPESIESVLRQTHPDFELILVDDGSTDGSREVMARYQAKDTRIRILSQHNGGQASAFNAGFAVAQYPFIAFLDSDDSWSPDKLSECLAGFTSEDIVAVQHDLQIMDSSSRPTGKLHSGLPPGVTDLQREYLAQNHTCFFCPTSSLVCRRTALERIFPIDPAWRICADVAFTRPIALFGKLRTLKPVLGSYRVHGNNTWMNSSGQQDWIKNNLKYCAYANAWLARAGVDGKIDFKRSALYRRHLRLQRIRRNPVLRFLRSLFNTLRSPAGPTR